MKRIITLILTLAMLMSLCSCQKGGGSVSNEQISLNYPEYAQKEQYSAADNAAKYTGKEPWEQMTWVLVCDGGNRSTTAEAGRYLNALMQHSTGGKVSVTVRSGAGGSDAVQQLMYGDEVQLAIQSSSCYAEFDPRLKAASLPFLFPSLELAEETLNGRAGRQLKEVLSLNGMMCIGIGSYGFHQLMTTKPVTRPADLSGMTVAVADSFCLDFGEPLMSETVLFSDSGEGQTLGNGVDGICAPFFELPRQQSMQRYLTLWNFSYDPVFFCINQNLYSRLTDEQKKVITDNGAKAAAYQRHLQRVENDAALGQWTEDETVEVTAYEELDIALFKETTARVEEDYCQQLVSEAGLKPEEAEELVEYFHIE